MDFTAINVMVDTSFSSVKQREAFLYECSTGKRGEKLIDMFIDLGLNPSVDDNSANINASEKY